MMDSHSRSRKAVPWSRPLVVHDDWQRMRLSALTALQQPERAPLAERLLLHAVLGVAGFTLTWYVLIPALVALADALQPLWQTLARAHLVV